MKTKLDFDPADPNESEDYSFDFVNELLPNETISTVTFTLTLTAGTDASPSSRMVGSPGQNGTVVSQRLANLQPGATYALDALVTTNAGNSLSLWSHIRTNKIV